MKLVHPFLAVPIKATISSSGVLLSADPPIWRLHFLAGGEADTVVAVPGLAELADMALRTKMLIQRPVRAADEESDVELWVEATPQNGSVDILVTGWREVSGQETSFRGDEMVHASLDSGQETDTLMIDPQLRIVCWPSNLKMQPMQGIIGSHLGSIFVLSGNENGAIPVVDRLVEQRDVVGEEVRLVGGDAVYRIDLKPIVTPNDHFLGHCGTLTALEEIPNESVRAASSPDLPMGRQFASVLKQPLSRIVANAETIGKKLHGPLRDNYADYAQDIANAARHLSELVNDMEDLEAIDRPDFSVARDRIELGDISQRVAGLLALKAADHGITIQLPPEDEKLEAIGEFRRVLQIVLNLVGNAIRYAPDASRISIEIQKQAGNAALMVADEGKGVPIEDRERVFEKFERLGRSGDGGSGLGLYISRRLARAMGGDLVVESAPGGGALFRLTLPAR
jgi:nitrogen-specific signal transduction histidine kinase